MRLPLPSSPRGHLVLSAVLGLLAALLFRSAVSNAGLASPRAAHPVAVVTAARPVARGAVLSRADLRVRSVPSEFAPPGSFARIDQAAGRVALTDLAPGEAATRTRLARVRAGPVASLTPEGLRAFAVPTSLPRGSVRPGDRVDILATYAGSQPHTESVVSGVEVLLVLGPSGLAGEAGGHGSDISLDAAGASASPAVTLVVLVGPDTEQRLAYARSFASLDVAIAPSTGS